MTKEKCQEWIRRHCWIVTMLCFTSIFIVTLWPLVSLTGMPQWDASDLSYPNFAYILDSFREGRIPFWDPYTKSGYPFHAEPFQPILNPLTYLLSLTGFKPLAAFTVYWLLHWWWAGVGMIWLGKMFKLLPTAALISATCFAFSGFFIGHAEHTPFIVTAAWIPWIMGFGELGVKHKNYGYFLLAGFGLGMSAQWGYPPLVAFSGLALGLWLWFRYPAQWAFILKGLVIAAVILGLTAAVSVISFLTEGVGHTDRVSHLGFQAANFTHPVTPVSLISLFLPYAVFLARSHLATDISIADTYVGVLSLALIVYAFFRQRDKQTKGILYFTVFMFLVSLGGIAGLRIILYYVYPPMQYIRFSGVFRLYWIFSLCVICGMGVSIFLKNLETNPTDTCLTIKNYLKKLSLILLIVALAMATLLVRSHEKVILLASFLPALVIIPFAYLCVSKKIKPAFLIPALFLIDLCVHVHINHGSVWHQTNPLIEIEKNQQHTTYNLASTPKRNDNKDINHSSIIEVQKDFNIWGYTTMVSYAYEGMIFTPHASVLKMAQRFWLTPHVQSHEPNDDDKKALFKTTSTDLVPVYFSPVPKNLIQGKTVTPGTFGVVKTELYSPEEIRLSVAVPGDQPAALASTERWGNSWRATVDGIASPIYVSNLFFRGLIIPPGQHQVTWTYQPPFWKPLAILSEVVLLLSLLLGFALIRRSPIKT